MSVAVAAVEFGHEVDAALAALADDFGEAVSEGFFLIQDRSPVDTHRFQASHALSAHAPSGYVEPTGSTHPLRGQDHVDAALAALGDGDGVIFHETNLPYSERLAHQGWSQQAPDPDWMEQAYEGSFAAQFGGVA